MPCEPETVADWLAHHLPTLRRVARHYLPRERGMTVYAPVVDADDIAMMAAVKVWRHWHQFDGARGTRLSWACKIVQHTVYDWMRHAAPRGGLRADSVERRAAVDELHPEAPPGGGHDPHDEAVARETEALILDEITPEQGAVVRLRLEGYPFPEIARRLRLEPDTAKQRFARARERIRALLAAHAADHGTEAA